MGNLRVSSGVLEFYNADGTTRRTVLRHVCPLRAASRVRLSAAVIDRTWGAGEVGLFRSTPRGRLRQTGRIVAV